MELGELKKKNNLCREIECLDKAKRTRINQRRDKSDQKGKEMKIGSGGKLSKTE